MTIDRELYLKIDQDRGQVLLSNYVEALLAVASEVYGSQIRELISDHSRILRAGARAPRVAGPYSSGRGGETAVARQNKLAGLQRFLENGSTVKHTIQEAVDDDGADIEILTGHFVKPEASGETGAHPFELNEPTPIKVERKAGRGDHAFAHTGCWGCDPILWQRAGETETMPDAPPEDRLSVSHSDFDLGYRFLVRVRSLEPEPGFATIESRIWARAKSAARRERKGRR